MPGKVLFSLDDMRILEYLGDRRILEWVIKCAINWQHTDVSDVDIERVQNYGDVSVLS